MSTERLSPSPTWHPWGKCQQWRRALYPKLWERRRFQIPTILVGSLHMGGVGKTAVVIAFAKKFLKEGKKVGVLSRGYGRRSFHTPVWVSEGHGPVVDVTESGDESWLVAHVVPEATVLVSASRVQGVQWLMNCGVDVILCDDGFQHLALQSERSIVLLPSEISQQDVTFPPSGRLREPFSALQEASEVWCEEKALDVWRPYFQLFQIPQEKLKTFERQWTACENQGQMYSLQELKKQAVDQKVHLVCALGRPQRFFEQWKQVMKLPASEHAFRDHSRAPETYLTDLDGLIVLTAKDATKTVWSESKGSSMPSWTKRCWVIHEEVQLQ